jgi:hypothetical protein
MVSYGGRVRTLPVLILLPETRRSRRTAIASRSRTLPPELSDVILAAFSEDDAAVTIWNETPANHVFACSKSRQIFQKSAANPRQC